MDNKNFTIPYFGFRMTGQYQEGDLSRPYLEIKPICKKLGISHSTQVRKLTRDVRFNHAHMSTLAPDCKKRMMFCLPSKEIGRWLNSISVLKVKEPSRSALNRLQKELDAVLDSYFEGRLQAEQAHACEKAMDEVKIEPVFKINGKPTESGKNLTELKLVVNDE